LYLQSPVRYHYRMSKPPFCILRVAKHSSFGTIGASAQHTFRERPTPNADPKLTHKNVTVGAVGAANVVAAIRDRVKLADTKAAVKPVLALEYLITASPEAFDKKQGGKLDQGKYFNAALQWLRERHGADNVVCANLQLDETSPHLVVYVVPLVEQPGKTRKRSVIVGTNPDGTKRRETREFSEPGRVSLSANHFTAGAAAMSAMQTDFHQRVGQPHGLNRGIEGSRARHTTVKAYYRAVRDFQRAELPAPSRMDALDLIRGKQPASMVRLAKAATAARIETERLANTVRAGDSKRRLEAQKQAKEARRLADDRKDVERLKNAVQGDNARMRGQIADLHSQLGDYEHETGLALVKIDALERELAAERKRAEELAERLAEYEPRHSGPRLGGSNYEPEP